MLITFYPLTPITQFLLKSPKYFDMTEDEVINLLSNLSVISIVPMLMVQLSIGFLFDIIGRRITIATLIVICSTGIMVIP